MGIYTDLVLETRELSGCDAEGVVVNETSYKYKIKRSDVAVTSEGASKRMNKKMGNYITIEARELLNRNLDGNIYLAKLISKALGELLVSLDLPKDFVTLCVGIGNRSLTADALGPKVVENLIVTRHIVGTRENKTDDKLNSVCAISPGVLGVTGIESFEVIRALCDKIKPDLIIVIDSLASRKTERISTTFQITDTGITPGGGLSDSRPVLDKQSLGVPVVAIGVPFVVYAKTMGNDVIEELFNRLPSYAAPNNYQINHSIKAVVTDVLGDLVVTPKDIDSIVKECAYILGIAINLALHTRLNVDDILSYTH
jgi:spore protease